MVYIIRLTDGTEFKGRRPWYYGFREGWYDERYKVVHAGSTSFTDGSIVHINKKAILWWRVVNA